MRKIGIGVAIAVALTACGDTTTNTSLNPEGPPMIRQVFALELVMDGAILRQSQQLAFGTHPDITVDTDNGDGVTNAVALGGQRIRVVLDELIRGNAIEAIACADGSFDRVPIGTTPDDIEACAGPPDAIAQTCCTDKSNPNLNCRANHVVCVDPTNGIVGVLDVDEDGAADDFQMIDGAVTLTCDGMPMALNLTESFYQPSGNQQITAGPLGINSLGPALVIVPDTGLRTGSNCVIGFNEEITDKDGNRICAPPNGDITGSCAGPGDVSELSFQVEPLRITGQDPSPDATNVGLTTQLILQMNANIDHDDCPAPPPPPAVPPPCPIRCVGGGADCVTLEDSNGGPVAGTVHVLLSDETQIRFVPDAPLNPDTTYTASLTTNIADPFGGTLPDVITFDFTTGSATPTADASVPDAMPTDAQVNDAQVFDAAP